MTLSAALILTLQITCGGDDSDDPPPRPSKTATALPTDTRSSATATAPAEDLVLSELLARPLALAGIAPGQPCPVSAQAAGWPADFTFPGLGDGPVYPVLPPVVDMNITAFAPKTLWISDERYRGPVVIRGQQLDGEGVLRFSRIVPVDNPTEGLSLPVAPDAGAPNTPSGWRAWPTGTLVPEVGCYGLQIEGTDFSTTVVFEAALCDTPDC